MTRGEWAFAAFTVFMVTVGWRILCGALLTLTGRW